MWWLESMVCAYLGLACIARANHRFHALSLPGDRIVGRGQARVIGCLFVALTAFVAIARLGEAQGIVALALIMGAVGVPLVLALSVRPGIALAGTVPFLWPVSTRRHANLRS